MLETILRHVFTGFNLCEGLLWIGIGAAFAVAAAKRGPNTDLMAAAGLLFITFGLSDFTEIQTGGWYRPWWLLVWKASNLVGLTVVLVLHRRRRTG